MSDGTPVWFVGLVVLGVVGGLAFWVDVAVAGVAALVRRLRAFRRSPDAPR